MDKFTAPTSQKDVDRFFEFVSLPVGLKKEDIKEIKWNGFRMKYPGLYECNFDELEVGIIEIRHLHCLTPPKEFVL